MSEIEFKGKEFVRNHHLSVPYRPLEPDAGKSVGKARLDGNLIIHGDNLHALKSLLPMYAGKVNCIYIDPPYNTGNEGWCYNDNVSSPQMQEWLQHNPVGVEDSLHHDKWLCMMWPRLQLLHQLLAEDGVIFISIDDNEVHRLRMVMDEIFGGENFINCLSVSMKETAGASGGGEDKKFKKNIEYGMIYCKESAHFSYNKAIKIQQEIPLEQSSYTNVLLDKKAVSRFAALDGEITLYTHQVKSAKMLAKENHSNLLDVYKKHFENIFRTTNSQTSIRQKVNQQVADYQRKLYSYSYKPRSGSNAGKETTVFYLSGAQVIFLNKNHELNNNRLVKFSPVGTLWGDIKTTGLNNEGNVQFTHGKKPKKLLCRIMKLFTQPEDIILDSFAGSGTTAQAVLELNKEDGGKRKFILVECEDYADDITAERVRQAIKGIKTPKNHKEGLGGEFSYCELGEATDMEKLLSGESLPSFQDLGALLFHTATREAIDSTKIDAKTGYLGISSDYHIWMIYQPDLAFLKSNGSALTLEKAQAIAKAKRDNKRHLVFASATFVSSKTLNATNNGKGIAVDYQPLPWSLYRVVGS